MPIRPGLPIPGSTALPGGFAHPHASEEARRIAEDGMILRVQVGSGVHGTSPNWPATPTVSSPGSPPAGSSAT